MAANFQMKIAICDDDEKDRKVMRDAVMAYLEMHNYHIGIDEFHSGEAFLSDKIQDYDLVILDIFMDQLNGIETAKKLVQEHPNVQIVFCSSSNAFAAESYDVSALRYLIKPVMPEKLADTLDRFFYIHTALRTVVFKQNRMDEYVYLRDLIWVEADGHSSILHTRNGDITTRTSISQLWEQVDDADFVKPIRYALVSLQYVAGIPTDVLELTDGTTVPISRDQRAAMKKAFSDYKMQAMLRKGGVR